MNFDPSDSSIIKKIENEKSVYSGFPRTLEMALKTWRNLAKQSHEGYNDDVAEYTNDLSSRRMIQEIYDVVSEEGKNELLKELEPIDEEFDKHTVRLKKPIIAYDGINPQKHFWFYRIPKKIKAEELSAFESQYQDVLKGIVETF